MLINALSVLELCLVCLFLLGIPTFVLNLALSEEGALVSNCFMLAAIPIVIMACLFQKKASLTFTNQHKRILVPPPVFRFDFELSHLHVHVGLASSTEAASVARSAFPGQR